MFITIKNMVLCVAKYQTTHIFDLSNQGKMKNRYSFFTFLMLISLATTANKSSAQGMLPSDSLYKHIVHMDSVLFNAFNNRDLKTFQSVLSTDLEFYHDKGGLTDYNYSIESFKRTIAQNNGLRRELVKGSLEIYPIKDYGAIQVALHTFCHLENGRQDCGTFKFIHVWKKTGDEWKITRVLSYDH